MRRLNIKRALVFGKGISGNGASEALRRCGVNVTLCDDADFERFKQDDYDLTVVSPAIPFNHEVFSWARERGVEIIGELSKRVMQ